MTERTLILIPGLGSDASVWTRTITALGDRARCIVGDTLSDDDLPGMARRILAGAPERFGLAGVSMGGMVAMEMMRIAPERVTGLALLDTSARPDTPEQTLYRRQVNSVVETSEDYRQLAEGSLGALIHLSAPQDVRDEIVEMSVRVGAKAYVRQNRAVMARSDLRPGLAAIAVPITVIVGREDKMTPVELSEEIHALTPGSTLHVIPDCGHLPPIERPSVTADLLAALPARR